jgi:hypothetical protein
MSSTIFDPVCNGYFEWPRSGCILFFAREKNHL